MSRRLVRFAVSLGLAIDWPAVLFAAALIVAAWVATAAGIGELPDLPQQVPPLVYAAGR